MLERYIKRPFFLEKGLKFFFYINMKKMKNQARNEIFRQMTMTLALIQNVIYVQRTRKGVKGNYSYVQGNIQNEKIQRGPGKYCLASSFATHAKGLLPQ